MKKKRDNLPQTNEIKKTLPQGLIDKFLAIKNETEQLKIQIKPIHDRINLLNVSLEGMLVGFVSTVKVGSEPIPDNSTVQMSEDGKTLTITLPTPAK